jgi:hypothetical protein
MHIVGVLFVISLLPFVSAGFDSATCPVGCWIDTKGNCFCPEPMEKQED